MYLVKATTKNSTIEQLFTDYDVAMSFASELCLSGSWTQDSIQLIELPDSYPIDFIKENELLFKGMMSDVPTFH